MYRCSGRGCQMRGRHHAFADSGDRAVSGSRRSCGVDGGEQLGDPERRASPPGRPVEWRTGSWRSRQARGSSCWQRCVYGRAGGGEVVQWRTRLRLALVHGVPPRTSGAMHRQPCQSCTLHRLSKCPWLLQRRSHLALRRRRLSQGSRQRCGCGCGQEREGRAALHYTARHFRGTAASAAGPSASERVFYCARVTMQMHPAHPSNRLGSFRPSAGE